MLANLLGKVISIVNSDPPQQLRPEFYEIKNRVLQRFGTRVGQDLQHIVKPCWHCNWLYCFECEEYDVGCCRCMDTGIYDQFWSRLDVYQIGKFRFHLPVERLREEPGEPVTITGYIRHQERGPWALRQELCLWLIVVFDSVWLLRRLPCLTYIPVSPRYPLLWSLSQLGRMIRSCKSTAKRFQPKQKSRVADPDHMPF